MLGLWPPTPKKHRPIWITTAVAQLISRLAFLCIWGYLCFSVNVLMMVYLLGRGPWLDLGLYLAIALLRPALLIQAALRPGSLPSQAWFEIFCHCLTVGIDIGFIVRLAIGIPSENDLDNDLVIPPFNQVSWALFSLAIILLSLDILISVWLSLIVLTATFHKIINGGNWGVWRCAIRDLVEQKNRPPAVLTNDPSTQSIWTEFALQCRQFLDENTLYRRNVMIEPVWLAAVRGTTALAALLAIFAFGILNTIIHPTQQFKYPLPMRAIPSPMPYETGFPNNLYGIVYLKRLEFQNDDQGPYWNDPVGAFSDDLGRVNFLSWFQVNASAGSTQFPCVAEPFSRWDSLTWAALDVGVSWHCEALGDNAASLVPDGSGASPVIRLTWSGTPAVTPILRSYIASVPIWNSTRPWAQSFGPQLSWNITVGTSTSLSVGRNVIYARPGTFLEMVGLKQKALEIVGYPVVSAVTSSTELQPQTIIEMSPAFGGVYSNNVDAWEEYIEHSMLTGLATTGGLYTSFDVLFIVLFGRSLISLFFGTKPLSLFGVIGLAGHKALREKLVAQYPGLKTPDSNKPTPEAVCDLLCDFILDIGPATGDRLQPAQRQIPTAKPSNDDPSEKESKESPIADNSTSV